MLCSHANLTPDTNNQYLYFLTTNNTPDAASEQ